MKRQRDAGREYAEIWGEAVEANRKLRTLATILGGACLALTLVLLRVATAEPTGPIVVRVDEVGRAEAGLRGRHGRIASSTVLMRRLLSLDYVLEHPDMPWLPTEPEKVGAFEALGADRGLFVYAEPGHDTRTALRSWGAAHRGLWIALADRGRSVKVVAIVRTDKELDRADAVLGGWVQPSGAAKSDAGIREEVARIERAILQGTVEVLEEFGELQSAMKRSVALEKQVRRRPGTGVIRRAST